MSQFPDEAQCSSWAGMCPGNNESARVKKAETFEKLKDFSKECSLRSIGLPAEPKGLLMAISIDRQHGKKRALIAQRHCIFHDIFRVLTAVEAFRDKGAEAVFSERF